MIKHIVCFKMKTQESIDKAIEVLSSMKDNVPLIIEMEVGKDFLGSPRSYDIILQVTLASKEDLDSYQKDPYHCDIVKTYMHANVSSSVAVDYEI